MFMVAFLIVILALRTYALYDCSAPVLWSLVGITLVSYTMSLLAS